MLTEKLMNLWVKKYPINYDKKADNLIVVVPASSFEGEWEKKLEADRIKWRRYLKAYLIEIPEGVDVPEGKIPKEYFKKHPRMFEHDVVFHPFPAKKRGRKPGNKNIFWTQKEDEVLRQIINNGDIKKRDVPAAYIAATKEKHGYPERSVTSIKNRVDKLNRKGGEFMVHEEPPDTQPPDNVPAILTKRYRIIELIMCDEHQRVSVMLLSEDGPKPEKFIREQIQPQVDGHTLMFQIVQPQLMPRPCEHGLMSLDFSPEEYAKLGSPPVNQTIIFKMEMEKAP